MLLAHSIFKIDKDLCVVAIHTPQTGIIWLCNHNFSVHGDTLSLKKKKTNHSVHLGKEVGVRQEGGGVSC